MLVGGVAGRPREDYDVQGEFSLQEACAIASADRSRDNDDTCTPSSEEEQEHISSSMAVEEDDGGVPEEFEDRGIELPAPGSASTFHGLPKQNPLGELLSWMYLADDEDMPHSERSSEISSNFSFVTARFKPVGPGISRDSGGSASSRARGFVYNSVGGPAGSSSVRLHIREASHPRGSAGPTEFVSVEAPYASALQHMPASMPEFFIEILPEAGIGPELPVEGSLDGETPLVKLAEEASCKSEESDASVPSENNYSEADESMVPSDEECRTMPPQYVMTQPAFEPSVPARPAMPSMGDEDLLLQRESHGSAPDVIPLELQARENEDAEWLKRKKLTGAICRLVKYQDNKKPSEDILGLYFTRHRRLMVTALCMSGIAAKAGVKTGDQLVSIDGWKEFQGLTAEAIRIGIKAPVTLVFLGFAGKLEAEVRVRQPAQPRCGLPAATDVAIVSRGFGSGSGSGSVQFCEAVVFRPATSLLLVVPSSPALTLEEIHVPQPRQESHVYELHRDDARRLMNRALRSNSTSGV